MTTKLKIGKIRIDGNTQPRTKIDTDVVSDYATAFEMNEPLPPVDVFHDGKDYWLADGFHRFHGASKSGRKTIACKIHNGTQRDAILFSVGANASHGLRRTNEDKRAAVMTLLNDPEWSQWSAREIARACAVSDPFVGSLRAVSANVSTEKPDRVKYTTKHGTESTQTTTKKTKPKEPEKPQETPAAETPEPKATVATEPEYRPGFDPRQFDPEMQSAAPAVEETPVPTGDVPRHLVEVIAGIKDFESFRRELSLLKSKAESLIKLPIGSYIRWPDVELHIDQLKADFRVAGFGDTCPDCKNKPDAKCLRCKGRGWIAQGQMGSLSDEHKVWLKKHSVKV